MLDLKLIRNNLPKVVANLKRRGFDFPKTDYFRLETQRKSLQVETEQLQNQRNILSKKIGQAKLKQAPVENLLAQVSTFSGKLEANKAAYAAVQAKLNELLLSIPNLLQAAVPEGQSEADNALMRTWGERPRFDFQPKTHYELGEAIGQMDFRTAAKLTGSRFVVLHQHLAKLQRALTQFMLDVQTKENGYCEVAVPYIVNSDSLYGTGQLPKFAEDQFKIAGASQYYLIPTAEVPLTNLVRNRIIDVSLPLKFVAHTPCFRSEAGAYGRDTKGMLRQHQFEKVELVIIATPETALHYHEQLTLDAEKILQYLKLPYRVMNLCGGDIGFSAMQTYDLEVWLPGQNAYREISSCSHCGDFQARRMKARFRVPGKKENRWIHTLNGSGLAVGRTLIAVMENYQQADGTIQIPAVLLPYMDGLTSISAII